MTQTVDLEQLYRRMVTIRLFEDAVQRLFMQGEIQGTTHLYQGQEAIAVGVCSALEDGDAVAATVSPASSTAQTPTEIASWPW